MFLIINWFIVPIIKNCMEFLYLFIDLSVKDCTKHCVYQQIGDYINLIFNEDDIRYLDFRKTFFCVYHF